MCASLKQFLYSDIYFLKHESTLSNFDKYWTSLKTLTFIISLFFPQSTFQGFMQFSDKVNSFFPCEQH